jgi:hypothetical protein
MHLTLNYPLPSSLTGKTNHHPGNIKWRLIVKRGRVRASSKTGKSIIRTWRDLSPPGRFLQKDEETGLWDDIGDDDARIKGRNALKEKKGNARRPK